MNIDYVATIKTTIPNIKEMDFETLIRKSYNGGLGFPKNAPPIPNSDSQSQNSDSQSQTRTLNPKSGLPIPNSGSQNIIFPVYRERAIRD